MWRRPVSQSQVKREERHLAGEKGEKRVASAYPCVQRKRTRPSGQNAKQKMGINCTALELRRDSAGNEEISLHKHYLRAEQLARGVCVWGFLIFVLTRF